MTEPLYQLRILGLLPEVEDREAVRQSLALLFKTPPEKVDELLRQPTVLRKHFARKAAERLHQTLIHAGVDCELALANPTPATPQEPPAAEGSGLEPVGKPFVPLTLDPITLLRPVTESPIEPTEADWRAFIGPQAERYLAIHQRMRQARYRGRWASFQASWHWPAFFFPPLWFWYRRLYGWALLSLPTLLLPGLANILWGNVAHGIYYRHARNQIRQMRSYFPDGDLSASLTEAGGVLRQREALPQAAGISVAAGLLALWLLLPTPPPPVIAEDSTPEATPEISPGRTIRWQSTSNKPIYLPKRRQENVVARVSPYQDILGVTPAQVQQRPQTPEAKTAQRMAQIKSRLRDFLLESRQKPIPKNFDAVQQITELEREFQVDGWGEPWRYQPTDYGYELSSSGADKQFGTEDDIWFETHPRMPTFMQRERAAALAARRAAEETEVTPLQLAPED